MNSASIDSQDRVFAAALADGLGTFGIAATMPRSDVSAGDEAPYLVLPGSLPLAEQDILRWNRTHQAYGECAAYGTSHFSGVNVSRAKVLYRNGYVPKSYSFGPAGQRRELTHAEVPSDWDGGFDFNAITLLPDKFCRFAKLKADRAAQERELAGLPAARDMSIEVTDSVISSDQPSGPLIQRTVASYSAPELYPLELRILGARAHHAVPEMFWRMGFLDDRGRCRVAIGRTGDAISHLRDQTDASGHRHLKDVVTTLAQPKFEEMTLLGMGTLHAHATFCRPKTDIQYEFGPEKVRVNVSGAAGASTFLAFGLAERIASDLATHLGLHVPHGGPARHAAA